jgi:hypothetical protein
VNVRLGNGAGASVLMARRGMKDVHKSKERDRRNKTIGVNRNTRRK